MGRGHSICIGLIALVISVSAQLKPDTDYRKADSVARQYAGHALTDLNVLVKKLTTPFTSDVKKFRAIYTWVCQNVEQDYAMFQRNKRQREKLNSAQLNQWNTQLSKQLFTHLLYNKRTVCTGYAYLIQAMAKQAGLTCVMIDGYGRTPQSHVWKLELPNHTWNAVKLNNSWYLCDATWSSGSIQGETHSFVKQYDDVYFLADPALFSRNHYPLDTTWLLLGHKPSLQDFVGGPVTYKNFLRYNIRLQSPQELTIDISKGMSMDIQFTMPATSHPVFLQINSVGSVIDAKPVSKQECEVYQAQYQFSRVGSYTVHILINSEIVMSYYVKVTKKHKTKPNVQLVASSR